MSAFIEKLKDEPAVVVGVVVAALALFGVRVSDDQASVLTQLVAAVVPLIGAVVTRQHVTPTRQVKP